jgi:hypothetical protein
VQNFTCNSRFQGYYYNDHYHGHGEWWMSSFTFLGNFFCGYPKGEGEILTAEGSYHVLKNGSVRIFIQGLTADQDNIEVDEHVSKVGHFKTLTYRGKFLRGFMHGDGSLCVNGLFNYDGNFDMNHFYPIVDLTDDKVN